MKRVAVLFVAVSTLLAACGGPDGSAGPNGDAGPTTRRSPNADWLVGKTSAASCVEDFNVKNLAKRSWAFDGTVTDVVPPRDEESEEPADIVTKVTFSVKRWYKGGQGKTFTALTYDSPGSVSSVEGQVDAAVGARILASGEDKYLWACGFSKVYTPKNARLFEEAFSST